MSKVCCSLLCSTSKRNWIVPLCYYCRNNEKPELVQCTVCSNKYFCPTVSLQVSDFICSTYVISSSDGLHTQQVLISELMKNNPKLFQCLGLQNPEKIFGPQTLHELYSEHSSSLAIKDPNKKFGNEIPIFWNEKLIKNISEVFDTLMKMMQLMQPKKIIQPCFLCLKQKHSCNDEACLWEV